MKLIRQNEKEDVYECEDCGTINRVPRDCDVPLDCEQCKIDNLGGSQ